MRTFTKMYQIVVVMMVFALVLAPTAAFAQESSITFAGEPLSGDADELVAFVMNDLRPAVATADEPLVVETTGTFRPFVPSTCFGVTERQADGSRKLLETIYKTDLSNGRFDAVTHAGTETDHGDWPPHLINFWLSSTQPIGCDELVAEISYRMAYTPNEPGALSIQFYLDEEYLEPEYDVMASNGGLGLFVASPTPTRMTVNGEEMVSSGCADCLAHTRAVTDTIGAGIYSPATVSWFGTATEDAPALTEMYVLPVPKTANTNFNVTVELTDEAFEDGDPVVYLWFGRFDMPR